MGFLPAAILCQEPWKIWQGFAGEQDNANPRCTPVGKARK